MQIRYAHARTDAYKLLARCMRHTRATQQSIVAGWADALRYLVQRSPSFDWVYALWQQAAIAAIRYSFPGSNHTPCVYMCARVSNQCV